MDGTKTRFHVIYNGENLSQVAFQGGAAAGASVPVPAPKFGGGGRNSGRYVLSHWSALLEEIGLKGRIVQLSLQHL
jgi:hypothetical protein